ncbi:hypothetical protein BDF22DRAFT_701568 [Syncephalis plumigaleata]|nr:hypothetical protein BDF22DRAFT_701568 [Syncephalis plumigaleata]
MQFEELPAETQRLLLTLDTHIRAQLRAADLFDPAPVIDDAIQVQKTARELQHAVASVDTGLTRDESLIDAVKRDVHRSFRAAEKGARAYEAFKQPSQSNIQSYANITHEYFLELATQMELRADQYQQEVEKIERHVTLTVREPTTSPQALSDVIRNQHAGLMSQAARVARLHDEVVRSRARYKDWRRRNYGDERDPFTKRQRRTHGHAINLSEDKGSDMNKSELRSIAESTLQPMMNQQQQQQRQQQQPMGIGAATTTTAGTKGFGGFGTTPATSTAATTTGGFGGFKPLTSAPATSTATTGGFGGFGTTPATSTATTAGGFGGFGATSAPAATPAATNNWSMPASSNATSSANAFAPPPAPVSTWPAGTGWGGTANTQDTNKRFFGGN